MSWILENQSFVHIFWPKNSNWESFVPKEKRRMHHHDNATHLCVQIPLFLGQKFHHNALHPRTHQIKPNVTFFYFWNANWLCGRNAGIIWKRQTRNDQAIEEFNFSGLRGIFWAMETKIGKVLNNEWRIFWSTQDWCSMILIKYINSRIFWTDYSIPNILPILLLYSLPTS